MTPHFLPALVVSWAISVPTAASPPTAPSRPATVSTLTLKDRCAIAGLVAKQVRDLLAWINPQRLPGVMGDDGFSLLIIPPGHGDEIRSLFARGEDCVLSLDRVYPSPGKIVVRLGGDPPEELATGRAYAMLFMRQLARGRWQFDWSLGATGYAGCPKDAQDAPGAVDTCRRPAFLHGAAAADIRIVVTRKRGGFEAEVANLEVPTWSAPTPNKTEPSP